MLPYELTGNQKSKILIICLHGFPDSFRLWDKTINRLEDENLQYLNISYPNFHQPNQIILIITIGRVLLQGSSKDKDLHQLVIFHLYQLCLFTENKRRFNFIVKNGGWFQVRIKIQNLLVYPAITGL